ncbi:MAG: RagB/SusD family nutrient uptake outer membrane protein [Chitinophagales bacterium]|nr:RagB/SusD family nutrient uptake outer membrane protein [Chitinophagales bacterium]
MKLKIFSAVLIAGSICLSSCEKKTLELQPYSSFSDQSAFSSEDRCLLALYGVYDAAQSGFYLGGAVRGYPFGAANIEQGDMRGEDMLNQAAFYQITYEATYNNASPNCSYMFQTIYSMVNKANLTIDGVKDAGVKGIISTATASQFEAECRFLRALGHHDLVLNFSRPYADGNGNQMGIIYRDFAVNSDATAAAARAIKRSTVTVADTYTKILADLDFAEANLPATQSGAGLSTYRATKASAIALKMRVKMHMGDWAGVISEGAKIVSGTAPNYTSPIGGWKLTATPDGPFANNTSTENLFSIKNAATDNPGVNGALPNMLGDPALGARGLVRVSPIIWSDADWKCTDLRRTSLYRTATGAVYTTKYRDYANSSDAAPQIRYAEVLLMLAEANARTSATVSSTAVDLLNAVRNRSVTNAADQYTVASFAAKNDLIAAILKERRIEFLAEGKRWGDISRLAKDNDFAPIPGGGIPAKVGTGAATAAMFNCAGGVTITKAVPALPYSSFKFVWPIPIGETQQNNNYDQNPNY